MKKHDILKILKIWKKITNLGGADSEEFKCQIFDRKCFIFDPLYRKRKSIFNIMSGLSHRPDQIYHLWKFTLGGPLIILRSIICTYALLYVPSIA